MTQELEAPLHVFRFELSFRRVAGNDVAEEVCGGAFAECTGLEATMEPKVVKAGGSNYGPKQLPGPVSFATVILKRGMTSNRDMFRWFQLIAGGAYANRLSAEIEMRDTNGDTVVTWGLDRCLPVKFKAADLNAKGGDIGIEELHLAHEGLRLLDQ
jgi:phage tail-like protein